MLIVNTDQNEISSQQMGMKEIKDFLEKDDLQSSISDLDRDFNDSSHQINTPALKPRKSIGGYDGFSR